MNETARKFGHPGSLLADLGKWAVLLRPAQVTLGSLVLLCKDDVQRFGDLSEGATADLLRATSKLEQVLQGAFAYDKINYLMLMMVDPDVHFHVIPRYAAERSYEGFRFGDDAWPGPPDVTSRLEVPESVHAALLADLKARFA